MFKIQGKKSSGKIHTKQMNKNSEVKTNPNKCDISNKTINNINLNNIIGGTLSPN